MTELDLKRLNERDRGARSFICVFFFFCFERPWWPQQWKKEESEIVRGERGKTKFIDLRSERWHVVGLRKARRRQDVP